MNRTRALRVCRAVLLVGALAAVVGGPSLARRIGNESEWTRGRQFAPPRGEEAVERLDTIGWSLVGRRTGALVPAHGESWYVHNGFRRSLGHGSGKGTTFWHPDGRVAVQVPDASLGEWAFYDPRSYSDPEPGEPGVTSPPWRWGVADQTGPTAPWIERGMTADKWWVELESGR